MHESNYQQFVEKRVIYLDAVIHVFRFIANFFGGFNYFWTENEC